MASCPESFDRDARGQGSNQIAKGHARHAANGQDRHPNAQEGLRAKIKCEPECGTEWSRSNKRDFSPGRPSLSARGGKVDLGSHGNLRDQSIAVGRRRCAGIPCPGVADVALRWDSKKSSGVAHTDSKEPRARSDPARKAFPRQGAPDYCVLGAMAV